MPKEETRFTLRIDKDVFEKVKTIAEQQSRSAAKQIESFLKNAVDKYFAPAGKTDDLEELINDIHKYDIPIEDIKAALEQLTEKPQSNKKIS